MKLFAKLFQTLASFFALLFGKFTWNTPPWINALKTKAKNNPPKFWGSVIGLIFIIFVCAYVYHWYQSRPQPEYVIARIRPPKITPNEKILVPDTLNIDFGIPYAGELSNKPVAPLSLVGKEVKTGIRITPSMDGKWTWDSDSHLSFTPGKDWPAGQTYTINFDKTFFTAGTKMESLSYSFTTLPFEAVINEFKFYQDPTNPKISQAVATVNFSYPVDADNLKNKIAVMWQAKNLYESKTFKYDLSFDEHHRTAYIHSEPLPLPSQARYLLLTLDKGIKAISGPSETNEDIEAKVLIPDAASYFKISHVGTSIVRNAQDRPEQVLTLETTLGVTEAELNKSLHVYLLPKDYPATAT